MLTHHTLCAALAIGVCLDVLPVSGNESRDVVRVIQDEVGAAVCVVTHTDADPESLRVDVREPPPPANSSISIDPAEFQQRPIRVVLHDAGAGEIRERLPVSFDPALRQVMVDGTDLPGRFVRVVFRRAWVGAGTTILAERAMTGANGQRVASQTECRIREADAAAWKN